MLRRSALLLAIGLAVPGAAHAAAAAKPAPPSKAEVEMAAFRFKVLMSALHAKEVAEPIKEKLFACIFENNFRKISDATGKAMAANKMDTKDPTKTVVAMAGICGYRPPASAAKPK